MKQKTNKRIVQGCRFCENARTNNALDPEFDLSYSCVGKVDKHYSIFIRSGANKSTVLEISHFDKNAGVNKTIGIYEMKYCPECGRMLFENNPNK